ncbi:hypothetical protein ZIOFF_062255 [Zingiber officinale]|uniref:Inositol polyphosphate-related phosphatase domain-containing protein n=1 Tax=Zingiber officinale TaxID=94328 RepID=A0A8J5KAP6_ZINOF|nr:hypothetical protein ZIOFF_062255 [Zingiber officinale]
MREHFLPQFPLSKYHTFLSSDHFKSAFQSSNSFSAIIHLREDCDIAKFIPSSWMPETLEYLDTRNIECISKEVNSLYLLLNQNFLFYRSDFFLFDPVRSSRQQIAQLHEGIPQQCEIGLAWFKSLKRRCFSTKGNAQEFNSDSVGDDEKRTGRNTKTETGQEHHNIKAIIFNSFKSLSQVPSKMSSSCVSSGRLPTNLDQIRQRMIDLDVAEVPETLHYRIFVATWNVGGKSPPSNLNLDDWLHSSPAADVYVLGFQEIVPLNAGNVLGGEDNAPAKKWIALIRRALNGLTGNNSSSSSCPRQMDDEDFGGKTCRQKNLLHRHSFHTLSHSLRHEGDALVSLPRLDCRHSVCDNRVSDCNANCRSSNDENVNGDHSHKPRTCCSTMSYGYGASSSTGDIDRPGHSRYILVASKQMVGIFLTLWVRGDIRHIIRNLKVSCVGRGLMGYLGNKGSISMSMSLHQTSFCFICSHLASGEKEGDKLRRNLDVMETLRKTKFSRVRGFGDQTTPERILEHDRIIWLGDLNYRIALSYLAAEGLVERRNWKALLEKDQLQIEQQSGCVFQGWNEGRIHFPPTYKYCNNSDQYIGNNSNLKEKRRTPAWFYLQLSNSYVTSLNMSCTLIFSLLLGVTGSCGMEEA